MSQPPQDYEFLRDFVRHGDEAAFASVVRRHLDLVYGTALRKVEDQSAAQEILQNVFAALARKAWQFAPDDSLPAWLHRTTLLESKQWLRGEIRRRRREQTAAELETTMKITDEQPALRALVPLLDEALLSLREKERTALLLRYYEHRSLREVGVSLGVGEDAAQKRVSGALDQLARFFQRRGFRTASVAAAAAALEHTATSAPALAATSVIQAALHLAPPFQAGLANFLARFASLTKAQTTAVCLAIAVAPAAWEWTHIHTLKEEITHSESEIATARIDHDRLAAEMERLRAESARLDGALPEAELAQTRNLEGERKLAALKARLNGLLATKNSRWPDDLAYVRIPKSIVAKLDLMSKFGHSGALTDTTLEILGITVEEKLRAEASLGNYWQGLDALMAAQAYETNSISGAPPGRLTKTVVVPPLGAELKDLAEATRLQINEILGPEREKILFGGWDEGAIQLFWPGNLWKISEEPQNFTVWADPTVTNTGGPAFGARWSTTVGSTGTEGSWSQASAVLNTFPKPIAARFFLPWLQQLGIKNAADPLER